MKMIKKIKSLVALTTIALLVSIMIPPIEVSAAGLTAAPVPSVTTGYFKDQVSVTLATTPGSCTYYRKATTNGIFSPGSFNFDSFISSIDRSYYVPGSEIAINANHSQTVSLWALSFTPKNPENCALSWSNIARWTLPGLMTPQAYIFDKEAPVVLINGAAPAAYYKEGQTPLSLTYTDSFDPTPVATLGQDAGIPSSIPSGYSVGSDGAYVLTATDRAQNVTEVQFVIDTDAPNAPQNGTPDDVYLRSTDINKLEWDEVSDSGLLNYQAELQYDSSDKNPDGSFATPAYVSAWSAEKNVLASAVSVWTEGQYAWHVRARDVAGNVGPWSVDWTFIVDNTAPVLDPIANVGPTNIPKEVMANGSDETAPGIVSWNWENVTPADAGLGSITFSKNGETATTISATLDGEYTIRLTVLDRAGNDSFQEFKFLWDATVNSVTEQKAEISGSAIQLSWLSPADTDLESVTIYKNIVGGSGGMILAVLENGETSYLDANVLPGVTYYYSFETKDSTGNVSQVGPVSALVPVETLVLGTSYGLNNSFEVSDTNEPEVKGTTKEKGEIKAATTDNKDDEKGNKSIPAFGIAILLLLLLFGLYLIYQQKPEWFTWMMFWKK